MNETLGVAVQAAIILFGGSAIWLLNTKDNKLRRWGSIVGIIGQPAWFISAYYSGQWGILVMCFWYTYSYWRGIWNYFLEPYYRNKRAVKYQENKHATV